MVVVGLAVGYVLGARSSNHEFDDVKRALAALRASPEYAALSIATRRHVTATVRNVADAMDGWRIPSAGGRDADPGDPEDALALAGLAAEPVVGDLVERVRNIIGRR